MAHEIAIAEQAPPNAKHLPQAIAPAQSALGLHHDVLCALQAILVLIQI
jgi:hypothetical protein